MKDNKNNHPELQGKAWDSRFKPLWFLPFLFCLCCFVQEGHAQCVLPSELFHDKEEITYDVYFKWGILMPKAGSAKARMTKSTFKGNAAWKHQLLLKSIGMVDKVFSVRDTIDTYFSTTQPSILFSSKRSKEGGYYQIDELSFMKKNDKPAVHSFRRSTSSVKIDSVMYSDRCIYDLLGSLSFIRSIDWSNLSIDDETSTNVAMGRDMIKVSCRYAGQQIIEHGNAKYKTRLFILDVYDDSFTQSKEAAEVWIGDDDNHLPIKIRAKLKLGAGEAYYNSSDNLKHPLNCRFVIKK